MNYPYQNYFTNHWARFLIYQAFQQVQKIA
jgi:hypothetical protein